jgi:hypothetical protein
LPSSHIRQQLVHVGHGVAVGGAARDGKLLLRAGVTSPADGGLLGGLSVRSLALTICSAFTSARACVSAQSVSH